MNLECRWGYLPHFCNASTSFSEVTVEGFHVIICKKIAFLLCRLWSSGKSILKVIADAIAS